MRRVVTALSRLELPKAAFQLMLENRMKKGDVLTVAICGAASHGNQTHRQLNIAASQHAITNTDVSVKLNDVTCFVEVSHNVSTTVSSAGVEMRALTGVTTLLFTRCHSYYKAGEEMWW